MAANPAMQNQWMVGPEVNQTKIQAIAYVRQKAYLRQEKSSARVHNFQITNPTNSTVQASSQSVYSPDQRGRPSQRFQILTRKSHLLSNNTTVRRIFSNACNPKS